VNCIFVHIPSERFPGFPHQNSLYIPWLVYVQHVKPVGAFKNSQYYQFKEENLAIKITTNMHLLQAVLAQNFAFIGVNESAL